MEDLETGLRLAKELLPYNIEVYEDPIRFEDLSWYRQMREEVEVPVARHLGAPPGILENILAGAVDAVNMGGNVAGLRKSAAVAEAADLPIWVQIFAFGSCVASTFAAHIACTLPNCTMPIDELPHIRVDDLSGGSMGLSTVQLTYQIRRDWVSVLIWMPLNGIEFVSVVVSNQRSTVAKRRAQISDA